MERASAHRRSDGPRRWWPAALTWLIIAITYVTGICLARSAFGQEAPPMRLVDGDDAQAARDNAVLRATPTTLRRLVRHFSFEESELRPLDMPVNFYRHEAPDRGYPPFGAMGPRDDHAAEGRWSFGFELNGGSMAARIPTGVLPIVPYGHYIITVDVRTEGLRYSAARLSAWLTDSSGRALPASTVHSQPTRTGGRWTTLTIELDAELPEATDLVIELELAQPRAYRPPDELIAPDAEDIHGRAWFDNLRIWHAPMIKLTTGRPGNIIAPGEPPTLAFNVRDLSSEPLTVALQVYDIHGRRVFERVYDRDFTPGTQRLAQLGALPAGWYRAVLDLRSADRTVGRQWVDFAVLAESQYEPASAAADRTFSIELTPEALSAGRDTTTLIKRCNVEKIVVPIWARSNGYPDGDLQKRAVELATTLARQNLDLVVALDELPPDVAEALKLERSQVLEALSAGAAQWQPYLESVMLNLGLDVQQWRVSAVSRSLDTASLEADVDAARRSLATFVPDPTLMLRWPAEHVLPGGTLSAAWLDVPHEVRPSQLPALLEPWRAESRDVVAHLHALSEQQYAPRPRAIDMAQRALFAWRAGVRTLAIDAPWSTSDSLRDQTSPSPLLVVWRNLADQLAERSFLGDLNAPGAEQCWILDSETRAAALIAWAGQTQGAPAALDLVLAETPVTVIDLFGNRRTVYPQMGGRHFIELTDSPVFIEGIDPDLAVFRSGFQVDPATIPAVHRLHEIDLVVQNPWPTVISGTLRLRPSDEWEVNPRVSRFTIGPGGATRLPIELVMDRDILSGRKVFDADVQIVSDREYNIHVTAGFTLGLDDLHVSAAWERDGATDNIIITEYISNRGDEPVTVNGFVHAPGFGPRLRPVGAVAPGSTAVQMFHFPGAASTLAGASIRYGIKEMDGSTRVNRVLEIPASVAPQRAADVPQP